MNCKKCGKKIDELEVFCEDCKVILKKEKELEELVTENKKLNELENTKELVNIKNLTNAKQQSYDIKEELKDIVSINDDKDILETKKNKKKIIIILSIILVLVISLTITIIIILSNKNKPKEEDKPINNINYEDILVKYGESITLVLDKYIKKQEEIPSWDIIKDLIEYKKYEVSCDIHEIYEDGKIYLEGCIIDGKKIEYTYGEKQEIKEGKKIDIYKLISNDSSYSYSKDNLNNSILSGTVTCKTENCEYISAYDKYVFIKENNEYYIYNYESNSIEFGPFNINNENYEEHILFYGHKLYGVLYSENGNQKIYNVNTSKKFENISGNLLKSVLDYTPAVMYKYGYVILKNGENNDFVSLKTGKVSYSIKGNINNFIEDSSQNLVYFTILNSENSKITIYNSNGKKLFNGTEFNSIDLYNNSIVLSDNNKYYIYDNKLKLILTSKEYDSVLGVFSDFIVVVNNENLEIVNLEDKVLATFDLKWDNEKYILKNELSGWDKNNDKYGIYLSIENIETPGSNLKCYYIPDTKEIGVIGKEEIE